MDKQVEVSTSDLRWLAGLLEGEGWFGTQRRVGGNIYPIIQLRMCDRDVVSRVARLWDRTITSHKPRNPNHSTSYRVVISGEIAIEWALCLLPYMGGRRRERIKAITCQWFVQQQQKDRAGLSGRE